MVGLTFDNKLFTKIGGVLASDSAVGTGFEKVTSDSRKAGPGVAFVAVRGSQADGHSFIGSAVEKGADLVVVEDVPGAIEAPWIRVTDSRLALSVLAAACEGDPTADFILVGVTGTDGKTSTAILTDAGFAACGYLTGLVGTVMYRYAGRTEPAPLTTPDPESLQGLFGRMREAGVGAAVMEVSSHALDQRRADGCHIDCAVFTNLTRDHLDYHKTHQAYAEAKMRLFTELVAAGGRGAVANGDDPLARTIVKRCPLPVVTFSLEPGGGDMFPVSADFSLSGIEAEIESPWGRLYVSSPLIGRHNLSNILAALGVAGVMGMDVASFLDGVSGVSRIPGRLDRVPGKGAAKVFVDYAHTPKALEYVLKVLRGLVKDRPLTVVMGAGGDRDRGKRPLMGKAAVAGADRVFVTSDNPRTEDPDAIISDIVAGIRDASRSGEPVASWTAEVDRRKAIEAAIRGAVEGEVVLIAGKGHESTQTIGTVKHDFSDIEVAGEFLDGC